MTSLHSRGRHTQSSSSSSSLTLKLLMGMMLHHALFFLTLSSSAPGLMVMAAQRQSSSSTRSIREDFIRAMDEASRKAEEEIRQTALMSRLLKSAKPVKTAFTRGGFSASSTSGSEKKSSNTNEGKQGEAQAAAGAERKLGNNNYVNYNYGYYNYEDNWQNQYNEEEEEVEEERENDDTYEVVEQYGLNLTNFALKYIGCQNIHTFSDEMAENENAEGSLKMNRFVVFRLCPKQTCSNYNQWGCDYNYGEYTMPMEDYMQTMEEYHIQQYQTYCKTCAICMTGRGYQMYDEEWEEQNGQQGGRDLEQNGNYNNGNYNNNNNNNNANYKNGNNYNNNDNGGGGGGQYYYYNKNSGYYNHNYGNYNNGYSGYNNGNNNRYNNNNNVNNGNYQNYNENNYKNQNGVYNDDYYYQNDDAGNNGYYADPYNNYNAAENDDMFQGSNTTQDDDGGSPYCMYAEVCEEYKAACSDDSLGNNKYMSYSENFNQYFQCSEFEFGDAVSYLAPHCRSDGFTIGIGIYEDQYCSSYVGDMVDLEEVTGQSFDDNYLSPYYPKQCISCSGTESYDLKTEEEMEEEREEGRGGGVYEVCGYLYEQAAKCNIRMQSSETFEDEEYVQEANEAAVCNFVSSLVENNYDEYGEAYLPDPEWELSMWKEIHSYRQDLVKTTKLQVIGILAAVGLCVLLFLYSCYLRYKLSRKLPWSKGFGQYEEAGYAGQIARIGSGITMQRSTSGLSGMEERLSGSGSGSQA